MLEPYTFLGLRAVGFGVATYRAQNIGLHLNMSGSIYILIYLVTYPTGSNLPRQDFDEVAN